VAGEGVCPPRRSGHVRPASGRAAAASCQGTLSAATYRLPTGGVFWGEPVLDALAREQWKSWACPAAGSMPGIIHYALRHAEQTIPFDSYVFLPGDGRRRDTGAPRPLRGHLRPALDEPTRLPTVADQLRKRKPCWATGGHFAPLPRSGRRGSETMKVVIIGAGSAAFGLGTLATLVRSPRLQAAAWLWWI